MEKVEKAKLNRKLNKVVSEKLGELLNKGFILKVLEVKRAEYHLENAEGEQVSIRVELDVKEEKGIPKFYNIIRIVNLTTGEELEKATLVYGE